MWELDCEEGWAPKNWCLWTVVLEKTLESPLDCKEIQPVHSEGDQPWDFFGTNDAKAETLVFWAPHARSWLIGKDSDAGRDCGQEEKGTTEDEMAGWHHWLDGRKSEWIPGVGVGQGGLACCDSWGRKELDMTEWLIWPVHSFIICIEYFLEKEMATHSRILAWRIPWTEEPGGLLFIGSQSVRHDWMTKHTEYFFTHFGIFVCLTKCHLMIFTFFSEWFCKDFVRLFPRYSTDVI